MNIKGHIAEQPRTVRQGSYGDGYERNDLALGDGPHERPDGPPACACNRKEQRLLRSLH